MTNQVFERIEQPITGQPTLSQKFCLPRSPKVQGELSPWRLKPRIIPMPEETPLQVHIIRSCASSASAEEWTDFLSGHGTLTLPADSKHRVEVQAACHSTAFLRWKFRRPCQGARLKVTYSEGYEREPLGDPTYHTKGDRLDSTNGHLTGGVTDFHDLVSLSCLPSIDNIITYEPFWFRTFRYLVIEIETGIDHLDLLSFEATQTNYPLAPKSSWAEPTNPSNEEIWRVSIRTLRNCMFDGYSDCPFYEQLQYVQDSRSSGLFHFSLSGDDRAVRQALIGFAASITPEGLVESRYPSHLHQVINGFPLFYIMAVRDHLLYFNDALFTKGLFPVLDRVLSFYDDYIDERGLVSRLPAHFWSYVDWAQSWIGTTEHPDGGVPHAGRRTKTHTYFSMVLSCSLQQMAELVTWLGRPHLAPEYLDKAERLNEAVRKHCYDGRYFTDSTVEACDGRHDYSQHCQVFAILCGAATPDIGRTIITSAFDSNPSDFVPVSYNHMHYAFRAFAKVGLYETMWHKAWAPWRKMLEDNLSTWEEDNVRHRSDCHAWGSLALYEFPYEVAGVKPLKPGWDGVLWEPRVGLSEGFKADVVMGAANAAVVHWDKASKTVTLSLKNETEIWTSRDGGSHGRLKYIALTIE